MLFAFDLDGTIVPNHQPIPEPIVRSIVRLRQEGHWVSVITGRSRLSSNPFLNQILPNAPMGFCNGASIETWNGETLHEQGIHHETVQEAVAALGTRETQFYVVTPQGFFVPDPKHEFWDWARKDGQELHHFEKYKNQTVWKIVFAGDVDGFDHQLASIAPQHNLYPWENKFLELTAQNAHKGEALAFIANKLSVPQKDVVAFGDGNNDFTMLAWAGRGIACGHNSDTAMGGFGDEIIGPPEEHGVAEWLKENIFS